MPRRRRLIVHSYDDDLRERLRDPEYVVMYLEALKEDDDAFRLALRHVAEAHGFAGAGEVIDAAIERAIGTDRGFSREESV
jgi:DNA-binding phage protein